MNTMKPLLCIFVFIIFSCQADDPTQGPTGSSDPEPMLSHDQFYFTVSDTQLAWIYDSRDTTYEIEPTPTLQFNEKEVAMRKMKVRGTSASRVRRKSFNVDTEETISFQHSHNTGSTESKDFRLLAMSSDLCYIENRIGFGLLREVQLFPLFFKYAEVLLNNETNGTYFLIENPNDYYLDKNDYAILIRRGYHGNIDSYKYDGNGDGFGESDYINAFHSIYTFIKDYQGSELYDKLDNVLNVRQYMQKIAFDYLIQNGDYTDEIYLYDEPGDSEIRFHIIPWDLDDIFSELPHEIGRDWGPGKVFGSRTYDSVEDVVNDVGEKLIFSIEDDLDYIIAKDTFLYTIYLEELEKLVNLVTENIIREEFDQIEKELKTFFDDPDIIDQSTHDIEPCDLQTLIDEINHKKTLLINRRQEILDQL